MIWAPRQVHHSSAGSRPSLIRIRRSQKPLIATPIALLGVGKGRSARCNIADSRTSISFSAEDRPPPVLDKRLTDNEDSLEPFLRAGQMRTGPAGQRTGTLVRLVPSMRVVPLAWGRRRR